MQKFICLAKTGLANDWLNDSFVFATTFSLKKVLKSRYVFKKTYFYVVVNSNEQKRFKLAFGLDFSSETRNAYMYFCAVTSV